jgi:uncharacterized protein (TIGR00369 family)
LDIARERHITWHDPLAGLAKAAELSGLDALRAIISGEIAAAPIAVLMNMRLVEVAEGRAVFEADPAEEHYNPVGVVHGGFALTILDSALGCAIHTMLPPKAFYGTTDVHARLLRPITKDTGTVRAEATVVSIGRTLGTSEARLVTRDGTLLATGTTACAIRRPGA